MRLPGKLKLLWLMCVALQPAGSWLDRNLHSPGADDGRRRLSFILKPEKNTKPVIEEPAADLLSGAANGSTGKKKASGNKSAQLANKKPKKFKPKHPQQCLCPRSLDHIKGVLQRLHSGSRPKGMHVTDAAKNYPLCNFNTSGIEEEMRQDAIEDDPLRKLQHEFYRSVRTVCPLRNSVIMLRRRGHCSFLAELKLKKDEKMYLNSHFDQVYSDKSRECDKLSSPPSSRGQLRQLPRSKLEQMEIEMVRWRALVEAVPVVMVVNALRHLVMHDGGAEALLFRPWDKQIVLQGLEREAQVKGDPEYVQKRLALGYVGKAMEFLTEEVPQEFLKKYPTCAVVGNAGILKLRRDGNAIDAHSLVIRVNQGPDGRPESGPMAPRFKDHVGSRTDMRILNRKWTELYSSRYSRLLQRDPPNVIYLASRADVKYIALLGDRLNGTYAPRKFQWLNDKLVSQGSTLLRSAREGIQEGLGIRFHGGSSPSSGFMALHAALHMCDKVTAFGFAIGNCYGFCKTRNMYHYFNSNDAPDRALTWNHEAHSFGLEGYVLKAMHVLGILCIEPPPMGIGACGGGLDGSLHKLGLLSDVLEEHKSVDFHALLHNETLLDRLAAGEKRMISNSKHRRGHSVPQPGQRPAWGLNRNQRQRETKAIVPAAPANGRAIIKISTGDALQL